MICFRLLLNIFRINLGSIPTALPSIFLMDGHLTKCAGAKGQIRPMIRFRFSFQRHG
jgi:hypothetical protein